MDLLGRMDQVLMPGKRVVLARPVRKLLTLPSLLLMNRYPDDNPVRKLFSQRQRREHLNDAVKMIRSSDIPQESYGMASSFGQRAEEALASLPNNEARVTLRDIVHYVLDRRS